MGMPTPPKPPAIPTPPPAARPPSLGASVARAALNAQKVDAQAETFGDTVATSPMGLKMKPQTAKSTLLGH